MMNFWLIYITIGALLGLVALLFTERKDMPALVFVVAMLIFVLGWPLVMALTLCDYRRRRHNAKR